MDIGVEEIRKWHTDPEEDGGRGWSDIGYLYVIRRSGGVETGRGVLEAGAHVRGYNNKSVGICLVGGVDADGNAEDNYTPGQMESLVKLLLGLEVTFPMAFVQGHRDFPDVDKECPCFDVVPWWAAAKEMLANA